MITWKEQEMIDWILRRIEEGLSNAYYRRHYKRNMNKKKSRFLYGDDVKDVLKNKQYMKDRAELFKKYGNGWWWELDKTSNDRHLNSHRLNRKRFAGKFSKEE